jgi:hypothetical protein
MDSDKHPDTRPEALPDKDKLLDQVVDHAPDHVPDHVPEHVHDRPTSSHSSDREQVSWTPHPRPRQAAANLTLPLQDSFEDASDMAPRPDTATDRPQSRARSLMGKRESTLSPPHDSLPLPESESPTDEPAPDVPVVSDNASDDTAKSDELEPHLDATADVAETAETADTKDTKGATETTDTPALDASTDDAPPAKSPLLTAHRISVTSDMDDVSLTEGTSIPFLRVPVPN